jgi:hypothetical protein
MQILIEAGNEIGIHGSFGTHQSLEKFSMEIQRLRPHQITSNRFHYLMFDNELTPDILSASDIKLDSTIGFADNVGFRRGTCYPFYLFDFKNFKETNIIEFPLIIMDTTLKHHNYLGLSPKESYSIIKELLDVVRKHNGLITILWHNTFFSDYKYRGWKNVYIEMLKYARLGNAYIGGLKQVYNKTSKNYEF